VSESYRDQPSESYHQEITKLNQELASEKQKRRTGTSVLTGLVFGVMLALVGRFGGPRALELAVVVGVFVIAMAWLNNVFKPQQV